jgi:THUMP domain-like/RNA cap guanine-N2 methyltransferase
MAGPRWASLGTVNGDPSVLLSADGRELLSRLAAGADGPDGAANSQARTLAVGTRLRREYPAELVATAMAQQELRLAARAKFSRAADMLFTRAGYEQSSAEAVASYRAGRFSGARRVADLCAGIGGDLLALAAGRQVLAVDRDITHARLAVHNAGVYGVAGNVAAVVADVRDLRPRGLDAVFIDPARRAGSRRFAAGASEPPLAWCLALAEAVPGVCVKAAPGLPAELIPEGWEAEFIADGRDLKEAVLWSGALAEASPSRRDCATERFYRGQLRERAGWEGSGRRRATVLDGEGVHTMTAVPGEPVPVEIPGEYLLDPNPAVTRAGLVEDLARALDAAAGGAAKIDPRIAFLTAQRPARTPFARTLRVLDSAPWNEKRFARRLRELDVGAVDIRRRGLAGDVEAIRRRLKLTGTRRATVVITRVNDKPWGLVCVDLQVPAPSGYVGGI